MKQLEPLPIKIQIKAYSKTELAELYNVSAKTLQTWLNALKKELGPRVGRFYTPKQIKIIFEELGIPDTAFIEEN